MQTTPAASRPRLFLDTGDLTMIRKFAHLVYGITTTPTILSRCGVRRDDFMKAVRTEFTDLEVHVEACGEDLASTIRKVDEVASQEWFDLAKVVFKIPLTAHGLQAARRLREESTGIRVNVHLVFTRAQALLAMAGEPAYIAPMVGRYRDWLSVRPDIDDTPQALMADIITTKAMLGSSSTILASSVRSTDDFVSLAAMGADAITLPPSVMEASLSHDLTAEAIVQFLGDDE
ncbi:transaldolase family protein [Catellatospora sp. NPDC049111]|uniref:transaldolase family protein n=1 Tax=Catellatospora sp. NPDC049111 TaxID=3155271 RepID=UPI0033D730C5